MNEGLQLRKQRQREVVQRAKPFSIGDPRIGVTWWSLRTPSIQVPSLTSSLMVGALMIAKACGSCSPAMPRRPTRRVEP
jgi:hypothetical protein